MNKTCVVAAVGCAVAVLALAGPSQAAERTAGRVVVEGSMEPSGSRPRVKRAARVRGFLSRRLGFYSYSDLDVTNVYGGSRTLFGSTNSYRDPFVDRQTDAGPFDHGFFFDSGIGPRGGNAPYP
jgi:hypothetical protein